MKKKLFDSLMKSGAEAVAFMEGTKQGYRITRVKVPKNVDVKAIRTKMHMTQQAFAETFGFSVDAVRNWEGKRRRPEKAARILLRVIERNPQAVLEATM